MPRFRKAIESGRLRLGFIGGSITEFAEYRGWTESFVGGLMQLIPDTAISVRNAGATPIKTKHGWLHIVHGVRNTAAGLRYVIYCFMTSLEDSRKVIYTPGGHLIAPMGEEKVGDVSNVVFTNGAIEKDENIYIYYASSDTRLHLATTTVEKMVDYCKNTPQDGYTTHTSVDAICRLVDMNDQN